MNFQPSKSYLRRLEKSIKGGIAFAERRQALRDAEGKRRVDVDITWPEAKKILQAQNYCCALTGIPFYSDEGQKSYGPMRPSFDRKRGDGPYSRRNVRIVLLGVNMLRGCGSDRDMYRIANALVQNAPVQNAAPVARRYARPRNYVRESLKGTQ